MEKINIPNHIGLILDGNRRWAKERNLPSLEGHKKGYENLKKIGPYILKKGVKYLSVYAFSTENFKRSPKEVKYLMDLIATNFKKDAHYFLENNIKVIFSGSRNGLREDVLDSIDYLTQITSENTGGVMNICINYGSHMEILDACKEIAKEVALQKISISEITEELMNNKLYQNLPAIDFLIRTSGEQRLSNFMLWQAGYAEFYFPKVHFPAFDESEVDKALIEYNNRDRRFGGNTEKENIK